MAEPTDSEAPHERRAEAVARRVERGILDGEFVDRLPAERALAQRLGVSRASLREGLGLLAARGLITRRQGDGTLINDPDQSRMAEIWGEMVSRHEGLQASLTEFRRMLECETAWQAARRHDANDRVRLQQVADAVERAYRGADRAEQIRSDVAYHRAIADASHNPLYSTLMASLLKLLHEHVQLSIAGLAPDSDVSAALRAQHAEVICHILARNADAARAAAGRHIEYVRVQLNHLR